MNLSAEAYQKYVGMTEEEAVQAIQAAGLKARIMCRDGQRYVGTCDFRLDRVNLTITQGKVTNATVG